MVAKFCILCSTSDKHYLCDLCRKNLPWHHHGCQLCALPLPDQETICGQCLQQSPSFDNTISLFSYENPIDYLVGQFKFHQQLAVGQLLSDLLLEKLQDYYRDRPKPEMIIPVPLHRKRLIERGYNQAVELAKPLAKKLQIPLNYRSATRIRHTQQQAELALKERAKNVRNAFAYDPAKQSSNFVAIVDDVVTTGHTVDQLSRCLKKAGTQQIDVWCIARTNVR